MSRLDDLIDLIQTTNEVYFITAPGRVRTAYILVDDIVELALKTFLQEKALEQREQFKTALEQANLATSRAHRNALNEYYEESITLNDLSQRLNLGAVGVATLQGFINAITPSNLLQHWSANDPDNFRNFNEVVRDVKLLFIAGHAILLKLDEAADRHKVRNLFYHDHQHAGLTIDDDKCLRALCGMFELMECLFPGTPTKDSFDYLAKRNKTVRCQIGVLRLKLASHGSTELEAPYIRALKQFNIDHKVVYESKNFEHSILHTISDRFFNALRSHINAEVNALEKKTVIKTEKIDQMRPDTQARHRPELEDLQHQLDIMRQQLQAIDELLAAP
jgi:hypothetical protein